MGIFFKGASDFFMNISLKLRRNGGLENKFVSKCIQMVKFFLVGMQGKKVDSKAAIIDLEIKSGTEEEYCADHTVSDK